MTVGMRIAVGLAIFLCVTGIVYGITSHEWRGTVMLLVCAVSFLYVGLVLRGALRRAGVPPTEETAAVEGSTVEEPSIGPSIWPFVFSLAALLLIVGVVGVRWMLIPGLILFAGAGAGWFQDIKGQWQPESGEAHAAARTPSVHQREEQPHEDDRG